QIGIYKKQSEIGNVCKSISKKSLAGTKNLQQKNYINSKEQKAKNNNLILFSEKIVDRTQQKKGWDHACEKDPADFIRIRIPWHHFIRDDRFNNIYDIRIGTDKKSVKERQELTAFQHASLSEEINSREPA
ncbi:MAG: hypothetical protein P8016_16530, partial [Sedimentisphaerales bacterium]